MKVDARKLMKDHMTMTVEVRIANVRLVKICLWIALKLVKLASWLGGYGLKINQEVGVLVTEKDIQPGYITDVPCRCMKCGWTGTVWACEPDIDREGSLGCPNCGYIISVND
jgi:hypothetical protein